MKVVYYLSYVVGLVFIVGETVKRGLGYFAINATTMLEDYVGGAVLLLAALVWSRRLKIAPRLMLFAWAYSAGGLFVPFFAHLEAWLRGATFRPDQPHEDIGSIVVKGVLWAICLACAIVSLRNDYTKKSAGQIETNG